MTNKDNLDYKYINAMRVTINKHEVIVKFGFKNGSEDNQEDFREEIGIIMLPFLAQALSKSLMEHIEKYKADNTTQTTNYDSDIVIKKHGKNNVS